MQINRDKLYKVNNYSYQNFSTLSNDEIKLVWDWRNHENTRKWMITNGIIPFDSHYKFVKNLESRDDLYYWLFFKDDLPVGVLSVVKVDFENEEGEPGYYLAPSLKDLGMGLEMQYSYKKFFFEELGFQSLFGHILYGNTNAYQMSKFFGAILDGEEIIDGRKYVKMHTPRSEFEKINNEKLTNQFVKFIKQNPIKW